MQHRIGLFCTVVGLLVGLAHGVQAQPKPTGELVIAMHVTLAPAWFDPAETPAQITPFGILYALHDALVRPLPGARMGLALAESWNESPDGLTYEFKLRPDVKFHNGDPCTTEDVQFSFERYKGVGAQELRSKVKRLEIVDARTIRFHLHEPWPDFMTFYGTTATAAGIVVPKKYLEQVGDDGFKKHPIGLGPYKFVSHTPGIELVLDANTSYWRKVPNIQRLVMKGIPEGATRLAMLEALGKLAPPPELILIDALTLPSLPCPQKSLIKGDRRSASIAAASIIAKVTRDRIMLGYDERFPQYGFRRHKGYPTPEHLAALAKHGPCPIHRLTFNGVLPHRQGELFPLTTS